MKLPQSSLFVSRDVRIITVALAELVGLNEAIILQQLWHWLERSQNERDGRLWVYNTYAEWRAQFPWWSERTIQRTLLALERRGLVISRSDLNAMKIDRTKWYAIDFDALERLRLAPPGRQDGASDDDDPGALQGADLAPSVPERSIDPTEGMSDLERRLYWASRSASS